MSYADFFRAMTPNNYKKDIDTDAYIAANKEKVNTVLHIADVDKNGSISFTEFFFFILLTQLPEKMLQNDFKANKGKMTMK